ncbi:SixA phosphatase family protein [Microbacterium sp. R86528]|uniref:SixA phosphatase family protein n=1 Tax=Microbacterium sp. R86528 TaxID=3093864 RepID=UPI0037C88BAF
MIQLALVRHAKSDWGSPELDDHDRPLNDRGRTDAPRMASNFARERFTPDVILSSTALRARTTAGFFAEELGMSVELQEQLYGAPASLLLSAAADSGHRSVMVVAHDPGMSELAGQLSGERIQAMPTCAVATFAWNEDDWSAVDALEPAHWSFNTPR